MKAELQWESFPSDGEPGRGRGGAVELWQLIVKVPHQIGDSTKIQPG